MDLRDPEGLERSAPPARVLDFPSSGLHEGPVHKPEPPSRAAVWYARFSIIVHTMFWLWLGAFLLVLPWTNVWTENSFLYDYPSVRSVLNQGFARGVVSGLGMLDIWIGIRDAVLYRDPA